MVLSMVNLVGLGLHTNGFPSTFGKGMGKDKMKVAQAKTVSKK